MDKTTLKTWFSRGKKPTAAQFAEWIDSYWHKGEHIPIDAIDHLDSELDQRAKINDASAGATTTTYSSKKIRELIDQLGGTMEADRQVVCVDTTDELEAVEEPSIEVLYLVRDTNQLYSYDADNGTFMLITEPDSTITIRSLSALDSVQDTGSYSVRWITSQGIPPYVRYTSAWWSLSVDVVNAKGTAYITQYLANRDGYYMRDLVNGTWSSWQKRLYAVQSDVDALANTVANNHAYTARKVRTNVHYCSSRMKFAMPKVGTTVLIDDERPHFWGFASFGRPKAGYTQDELYANPNSASLYEGVSSIYSTVSTDSHGFDRRCYQVTKSSIAIPDWVWQYLQSLNVDSIDKGIFFRVKPHMALDPVINVYGVSDTGKQTLQASYTLTNAAGSTGLTASAPFMPETQTTSEIQITNLVKPVVDLCVRLTLTDLKASTPHSDPAAEPVHYRIGDIVRFDGTQWQRIDRLATGRSVQVLYQKIEVTRTGENAFRYNPHRETLPDFRLFQFKYTSAERTTVAAPAKVLDYYLQQACSYLPNYHIASGMLSLFTKVGNNTGTKWYRCVPHKDYTTGATDAGSNGYFTTLQRRHLLVPLVNDNDWANNAPWYVDAYIVVVRQVRKFHRSKLDGSTSTSPYHRNIEISNRIPVRIAYLRNKEKDGTYTTTVRVRQFSRG